MMSMFISYEIHFIGQIWRIRISNKVKHRKSPPKTSHSAPTVYGQYSDSKPYTELRHIARMNRTSQFKIVIRMCVVYTNKGSAQAYTHTHINSISVLLILLSIALFLCPFVLYVRYALASYSVECMHSVCLIFCFRSLVLVSIKQVLFVKRSQSEIGRVRLAR